MVKKGEGMKNYKLVITEQSQECKVQHRTLAGVAQWTEHRHVNQRVAGSMPSQGTCLGCGPGPQQGTCKRQPRTDVSLPLFLSPFPCL